MKKVYILLYILILVGLTPNIYAAYTLIDSMNETADYCGVRVGSSSATESNVSTGFNASQNYNVGIISVHLDRINTPNSNMRLCLYTSTTNFKPVTLLSCTDWRLATGITSNDWNNFTMPVVQAVTKGTNYSLVIESAGGDVSPNQFSWCGFDPTSLSGVNPYYWNTGGGVWSTVTTNVNQNYQIYSGTTSPISKIIVTLMAPANNTIINNNLINLSFMANNTDSTYTTNTCTLWHNISGVFNATTNKSIIVNATNTTFTDIPVLIDGQYKWNVVCNLSNGTNYTATNDYYFVRDAEPPTTVKLFTNKTIYYRNNITGQFNFTDNNLLYSYNATIDGVMFSYATNMQTNNYSFNMSVSVLNITPGIHTLSIRVADAHTDEELKDGEAYNPKTCLFKDCLTYEFNKPYNTGYISISQKDSSILDTWSTEEKVDRYSFSFEPSVKKTSYTFVIDSLGYIDIIENDKTKYKKWLIYDDHWLDFYPYDTTIKRIKDNQVEVTINNVDINTKILNFNSIGDLNIVWYNYTFYTTNATASYVQPASETESQTMTLTILKDDNYINFTNATLSYNNSYRTVTRTAYPTYDYYTSTFITPTVTQSITNVTFFWNYSIISNITNETGLLILGQNVNKLLIDNCTNYTIRAINFTIKDDNSSTPLISNVNGYFKIWKTSESTYAPFNITWGSRSNYSLCISNESSIYNVYAQIEFTPDSYYKETYYLYNITLNNETKFVSLYSTANANLVTFTVTDEDDLPIQGAYIHVMKYDLPTNTALTTEILKTSSSGTDIGHIVLDNVWYKFMIYYNGVLKQETAPVKISTLTKTFRISLGADTFGEYTNYKDMTTSLSFNNATKTFTYVFSSNSGLSNTICLKVIKRTALADTYINNSCVTAASGVIIIPINEDVGTSTYVAMGYREGSIEPLDWFYANFNEGFKKFGKDGIFVSFLLRLSVVMIAIWSPVVALVILGLIDVVMYMTGLYYMSIPTIVVYITMLIITMWRINRK